MAPETPASRPGHERRGQWPVPGPVREYTPYIPDVTLSMHQPVLTRQLPFAAVLLLLVVSYLLSRPAVFAETRVVGGVAIALVAITLALTVPWHRAAPRWAAAVPILDIVAVGFLESGGLRVGAILILPVLWMSTAFGTGGIIASVAGGTAAIWVGTMLADQPAAVFDIPTFILLPVILAATGLYLNVTERLSAARQALISRQSVLLAETLDDSRRREQMFATILNTIDVDVIALDETGRINMVNRAHNQTWNGSLAVGDTIDDLPPEHRGYRSDGVTALLVEEEPFTKAVHGEAMTAELLWWERGEHERIAQRTTVRQLRDGDGGITGAVIAAHDLTAELHALNQLEDFVSSVTHELRTPLTSILGYLELTIDDDRTPPDLRDQLKIAERNAERLLGVISNMLTAAHTRRGSIELGREEFDLRDVIAEVMENQALRVERAGLTMGSHGERACPVWADRARLTQVVENLVTNAVKYSKKGGHIEIGVECDDDAVRLEVRDDGIGIAESEQDKIFDRFYRADAVRKSSVSGMGLGLNISRGIVQTHHGTIEVRSSKIGVGTTMVVSLPVSGRAAS
ncbi:MAG: sensor histidine kinase [Georgenia sp.]